MSNDRGERFASHTSCVRILFEPSNNNNNNKLMMMIIIMWYFPFHFFRVSPSRRWSHGEHWWRARYEATAVAKVQLLTDGEGTCGGIHWLMIKLDGKKTRPREKPRRCARRMLARTSDWSKAPGTTRRPRKDVHHEGPSATGVLDCRNSIAFPNVLSSYLWPCLAADNQENHKTHTDRYRTYIIKP